MTVGHILHLQLSKIHVMNTNSVYIIRFSDFKKTQMNMLCQEVRQCKISLNMGKLYVL